MRSEVEIIGCSDAILASCTEEAAQFERLYGADPSGSRSCRRVSTTRSSRPAIARRARPALDLGDHPVLLFVGRIQPLKGLDVAVRALAALDQPDAVLVVVGGPSGTEGDAYLAEVESIALVVELGVADRVRFVAAAAAPPAVELLPRRRRVPGAEPVRVVRARRARGGRVRHARGRVRRRRLAHARRSRRTGLPRRGPRSRGVRGVHARSCSTNGVLAAEMSAAAAARAGGYTWSMPPARLRRLYADLTVGALVECS